MDNIAALSRSNHEQETLDAANHRRVFPSAAGSGAVGCVCAGRYRKPVANPDPEYPEIARRMNITGTVRMEIVIAADGTIGVYNGIVSVPLYGTLPRNAGRMPMTVFDDLRFSRMINVGERMHLSGSVDVLNFVNKFDVEAVNSFFAQAGQPTAAFDPQQVQLGLKLSW